MGVRVSRPSCRDPHVLLHVNSLPDKHTSYKIMAQKKPQQGKKWGDIANIEGKSGGGCEA